MKEFEFQFRSFVAAAVDDYKKTTYGDMEVASGVERSYIHKIIKGYPEKKSGEHKWKPLPDEPEFYEAICRLIGANPRDFPEYRTRYILNRVRDDPELQENIYQQCMTWGSVSREYAREGEAKETRGGTA